jgi:transposase
MLGRERNGITQGATMKQYVGLDVATEETKIHVVDEEGRRMWRGKCRSHPDAIESTLRRHAPDAVKIGLETGPMTSWLWTELRERKLPMVCLDARQAKKALDMKINKTDANDAEGLAHLVRSGWYCEVRVKSREALLVKALVSARGQLLEMTTSLSNQIRGIMKTFGLVVPKGSGGVFERNVRGLLMGADALTAIVTPLLQVWQTARVQAAQLDRRLVAATRGSATCRRLMTMPGIGAVTAASYAAAVEAPENFACSRAVGAWIGLTPRRYQSGEVDCDGHISRRGDGHLRGLLYEAATCLLTRVRTGSTLRSWGLSLKKRIGFKRAAVALARKMAVVLHAMWQSGADFDPQIVTVEV